MAKKKKVSFKISKLLFGELAVLILLTLVLIYSNTRVYQSRKMEADSVKSIGTSANNVSPTPTKPVMEIPEASGRRIRVPILMYHYIGGNPNPEDIARNNLSVTPEKFDEQMGYLSKSGYTPITLDTMMAGLSGQITLPEKTTVLTFDDGYIDFYFNAFPILQKYSFKSVLFVPTGFIGKESYLSWDQLGKLQSSGLVSIQAHSVNHAHLISLDEASILYELQTSKKTLEEKYGIPVNFVAYPYGASNQTVWNVAKRVGYIGALGTWSSVIQSEGTIFDMPRIKIGGSFDLNQFAIAI